MPIRVLDNHLIDQIAAGEVIERPASIVKELVENSLDAGAQQHRSRNRSAAACGSRACATTAAAFPPSELPLALSRHATSKIASADDLAAITTLGFRGEALPSIASVSRFEIVSRHVGRGARRQRERRRRAASASRRPRRIRRAPPSKCATCSTTCRRAASSCAAKSRSRATSCGWSSGWRCRAATSRSACASGSRTLLDAPALSATATARAARLARIVGARVRRALARARALRRTGAHLRLDRRAVGRARHRPTCSSGSSTAARCATAC